MSDTKCRQGHQSVEETVRLCTTATRRPNL